MTTTAQRDREAQWEQGQVKRAYRSRWAIDAVRNRIPPKHYWLAQMVADKQALIEGVGTARKERIDGSNAVESALNARIQAARDMAGYEQAVLHRWSRHAVLCLRGIAEGDSMREMIERCGLGAHDKEVCVTLIQATLEVLQDYLDENAAAAGREMAR